MSNVTEISSGANVNVIDISSGANVNVIDNNTIEVTEVLSESNLNVIDNNTIEVTEVLSESNLNVTEVSSGANVNVIDNNTIEITEIGVIKNATGYVEALTTLSLNGNNLVYTDENGTINNIDISGVDTTNIITSVSGRTGDIILGKGDVGLNNIDNTSDVDKPVSTAQQTEIDKKANILSWSYLASNWSLEPTLNSNNGSGDIYNYVYGGVTRYRFVPTVYNPTEDAFYEEVGLTNKIVSRG